MKTQLHLKEDAKPIFRAKRPVTYAMLPLIEDVINRLQSFGIFSPVDFSDGSAHFVAIKKLNGKIRVCGDYSTGLNDGLELTNIHFIAQKTFMQKCINCCLYTHIDLSDAYLQTEVTPVSVKLLNINIHRGLFIFNRLAPDVNSAPGAFQKILNTMLAGTEDAAAYIDDIIVGGTVVENT